MGRGSLIKEVVFVRQHVENFGRSLEHYQQNNLLFYFTETGFNTHVHVCFVLISVWLFGFSMCYNIDVVSFVMMVG